MEESKEKTVCPVCGVKGIANCNMIKYNQTLDPSKNYNFRSSSNQLYIIFFSTGM